jgi:hypothetical protein
MVIRRVLVASGAAIAVVIGASCKPDFGARPSNVEDYRVLAVLAEPAEWVRVVDPDTNQAKPAKFTALVADPLGTVTNANLEWAFCTLPKPLKELNDVAVGCFGDDPRYLVQLGKGAAASAAVPEDACRQFGPDIPEDQSFRPADPDVTGGYYQPLRLLFRPPTGAVIPAIAKVRIRCGLPGASQEQVAQYNRSYHVNTNPVIASVTAMLPAGPSPLTALEGDPAAPPLAVAPGESVALRVTWPACPLTDACGDGTCGPTETKETGDGQCEQDCKTEKACGGAERYLAFHLDTRQLVVDREVLRASWYVSSAGGSFRDDRTGRTADETDTFTENVYTAPESPGLYPLWVVLRDDRGGLAWKSLQVQVGAKRP